MLNSQFGLFWEDGKDFIGLHQKIIPMQKASDSMKVMDDRN
jgi:hypothetical protein